MNLWATRTDSMAATSLALRAEAAVMDEAFDIVDESIARLENTAPSTPFTAVAAVVLIKARNLALGCYSLALDGLAQESGALLRPLIEALELLVYLRLDPERANEATSGSLPRAGDIAKTIAGKFQRLRDYLNVHASHFSFSLESLRHILDFKGGERRREQVYNQGVLRTNIAVLHAVVAMVGIEGSNCLQVHSMGSADDLADRIVSARARAREVFSGVVPAPPTSEPDAAV